MGRGALPGNPSGHGRPGHGGESRNPDAPDGRRNRYSRKLSRRIGHCAVHWALCTGLWAPAAKGETA